MSKVNGKKVSKKNQLHDIIEWDINNLVFCDPDIGTVPNTSINFFRVNILTINQKLDDEGNVCKDEHGNPINTNTMGDLLFKFDKHFCFGVSETKDAAQQVVGYAAAVAMYSKDGATEREIQCVKKIEEIIEKCKQNLLSVKKEIKKPKLEYTDLKDLSKVLYWKVDDEGERVQGQGPTFSPKLIETKEKIDKKTGKLTPKKMNTIFYLEDEVDDEGEGVEVNPLEFLNTDKSKNYCHLTPVVKFESIFFGVKIAIQCKITESDISRIQSGPQRLLHNKHKVVTSNKTEITENSTHPLSSSSSQSLPLESSTETTTTVSSETNNSSSEQKNESVSEETQKKKVTKKKKELAE